MTLKAAMEMSFRHDVNYNNLLYRLHLQIAVVSDTKDLLYVIVNQCQGQSQGDFCLIYMKLIMFIVYVIDPSSDTQFGDRNKFPTCTNIT